MSYHDHYQPQRYHYYVFITLTVSCDILYEWHYTSVQKRDKTANTNTTNILATKCHNIFQN